jgi:LysR family cys regulon transcriptional activator
MKLHQLTYLCEITRQGLSFSNAAAALETSQPGISKQMRLLERELGVELFVRSGNRIVELTEPGRRIVDLARMVLRQTDDIKAAALEFTEGETGRLHIGATFTLARYVLPGVLKQYLPHHPKVELRLMHGSSNEVCGLVAAGEADIALTTQPASTFPELAMLDYGELSRALLVPRDHPLASARTITLKAISTYPLVTLDAGSQGQATMRELFLRNRLEPNIALSAANIDVVKALVEAGIGIAILPRIAFDPERDCKMQAVAVDHLFAPHRARIALRRNHYLRGFELEFVRLLAPHLDRRAIERATQTPPA